MPIDALAEITDPAALQALPARDRVLVTAARLFYTEGVRATGIDRVIAEAGVTKVTFYRHFPAKSDLVLAFLARRHERWMAWFTAALARHARPAQPLRALVPALREWLGSPGFRGCAFINTVAELAGLQPEVLGVAQAHKAAMTAALAGLLPPGRGRAAQAQLLALGVDGAIVQAQGGAGAEPALRALALLVERLEAGPA